MKFKALPLRPACLIEIEPHPDPRGFFARAFCREEFEKANLSGSFVQCNLSWNRERGTLRGLHYQVEPHPEVKVVRCTRGSIFDVVVDVRAGSPTRARWHGVVLSAENRLMMYVPEGFAHGYQTLEPDTEVFYLVSEFYSPADERGVRWNDPAFNIRWPIPDPILSEKDRAHPDFER